MKITSEFLEKVGASKEGIEFLNTNFNGAAEPLEIIEKFPQLPMPWIHFVRQYFLETPEEIQKYNEICNIINSTKAILSTDVYDSYMVINSNSVKEGQYVFDTSGANNSSYIYNCVRIKESNNIKSSIDVENSSLIISSDYIRDSTQIYNSSYINWSHQVTRSININDSSFIYMSKNISDCYFCGFLLNCKHCLFCYGLEDKDYYIFNEPVSPAEYSKVLEELIPILFAEVPAFISLNDVESAREQRFVYSTSIDAIFKGLSRDFYNWVYELKWFTEEKFMNLFYKHKE